jgi:hypothetical protein
MILLKEWKMKVRMYSCRQWLWLAGFALIILSSTPVQAVSRINYISSSNEKNAFALSVPGRSTTFFMDSEEYIGVIRALNDLKVDVGKVTGVEPRIAYRNPFGKTQAVIVGTIGKSKMISKLVHSRKLDVSALSGKWEHYLIQVVSSPCPGVDEALVIAGSDKRGTIYGIYDVSEKIGISPWYWWADVPVKHQECLYVKPGRYLEGPSVKYRGIFLNDEAPALSNWVKETYGEVVPCDNPPIRKGVANYGHEFYCRIFELLLRLKANYLWPAMWGNAFNEDDPENPRLADEYGIVMGTSHQEPMLRAQQEWDRRYFRILGTWDYVKHPDVMQTFWREGLRRNKNYESIITMGLRGANDSEMKGERTSNISMVEGIIYTQQNILKEELERPLDEIPQTWCLYKEINDYYNDGMNVPDDITLLWADDNWGNIRRLPDEKERLRKGGSGVYYHFDYHGGPRSYEWINTNPLPKIWDQMALAKQYGADRIWIVNVGHFRGYELPTEYFMDLAWNTDCWTHANISEYTCLWADREFGPENADDIADILSKYGKFNARRKPESLTPTTYSLIHYNEADNVVSEYKEIARKAELIAAKLPVEYQDAFYHLVLFPAKIGAIVNDLYVTAGKNQLYASQGRASTNVMAARTRALFDADTSMMTHYNKVYANGKWNHFMDQPHLGYTSWNPPKINSLNAIRLMERVIPDSSGLGLALEGSEKAWPGTVEKASLPNFDGYGNEKHWMEVFNRGKVPYPFKLTTDVPWLTFSEVSGIIDADKRIWITLNNDKLPEGKSKGLITVTGAGQSVVVEVAAFCPSLMEQPYIKGFVESGGIVSIEPEHFSKNIDSGDRQWIRVEDYGLNLSGMRATAPANASAAIPGKNAPCLEYPVYFFSSDSVRIHVITSPILNFMPGRDIRLAVSLNEGTPACMTVVPASYTAQATKSWEKDVLQQSRHLIMTVPVIAAGPQLLKIWMITPGVVLQKIVLQTGTYQQTYLGPPESMFLR